MTRDIKNLKTVLATIQSVLKTLFAFLLFYLTAFFLLCKRFLFFERIALTQAATPTQSF